MDEIFNYMPNVFGIVDDILVIRYYDDGTDHNEMVYKVLQRCKEVNLKLNKEKCHFRCTFIPFFGEGILRREVQPDPQKIKVLMDTTPPNNKREHQAFLGIIKYLSKFSPGTPVVCNPLQKLTSSKTTWTCNASYQLLFVKAKLPIKFNMCMKFYDDTKPFYIKTEASGVGLGTALLQTQEGMTCQKDNTILHPIPFSSKSLMDAECGYSNIEREVLGILGGLKKFHHCWFVREVYVITNHKPLVSTFKKDMTILSQHIQ